MQRQAVEEVLQVFVWAPGVGLRELDYGRVDMVAVVSWPKGRLESMKSRCGEECEED